MDDEIAREHVERICRTALPKYGPAGTPRERRVVVTDLTPPHLVAAAKVDGEITEPHRLVKKQ